jgi:hypothetical protein
MERRSFIKNSIGTLLYTALTTNKVLASVIEHIPNDSLNVLIYLIQNKNGNWEVKGTKWSNIKSARLSQFKYDLSTFKPIEVVDSKLVGSIKEKYWKQYNCKGRLQKVNYVSSYKSGIKAKHTGQLNNARIKSYGMSHKIHKDWWIEHGKKIGEKNKLNGHLNKLHELYAKDLGKKYGKLGGAKTFKEKLGIHAATKEKRKLWASIGGNIGGKITASKYDMKQFSKLGNEANIKKYGKQLYAHNHKTYEVKSFDSIGQAEKYTDVQSVTITKILRGLQPKTRCGWTFSKK